MCDYRRNEVYFLFVCLFVCILSTKSKSRTISKCGKPERTDMEWHPRISITLCLLSALPMAFEFLFLFLFLLSENSTAFALSPLFAASHCNSVSFPHKFHTILFETSKMRRETLVSQCRSSLFAKWRRKYDCRV